MADRNMPPSVKPYYNHLSRDWQLVDPANGYKVVSEDHYLTAQDAYDALAALQRGGDRG